MKKFFAVILCLLVLFSALACTNEGEKNITVIVSDGTTTKTFSFTTEKGFLAEALDEMENDGSLGFSYEASSGFVTSVCGIVLPEGNYFWAIYTDATAGGIEYFLSDWGTYEINEKTFGSATKGIDELPLADGATYVFAVSGY